MTIPVTPILISNGEAAWPCDGTFRRGYSTPLTNKILIGAYLFGNLITDPAQGCDICLWSSTYGTAFPPPYEGGASSEWATLCDLHLFSQPAGHTGGRQGQNERWFPAGYGVPVDWLELLIIGWGGGTVEVFCMAYVVDGPTP